jgi:hypothetical protein
VRDIISITQILLLMIIGFLLFRFWRKLKSLPENEVIGEERSNDLIRQLTLLTPCLILEAILTIVQILLR